jgi:hypothetical protein
MSVNVLFGVISVTYAFSDLMQFQEYIKGCLEPTGYQISVDVEGEMRNIRSVGQPGCTSTVVVTPAARVKDFQR